MISLGGSDQRKLVGSIANLLAGHNFNLHVVIPKKSTNSFFKEPKINMYYDLNAKDMGLLMQRVDLCIAGGGQILNELAYLGVPTIAIGLAENQLENVKSWKKIGFLEYIGWHKDKDLLKKMNMAVNKFITYPERVKRSKLGRKYVDGKGALRVADRIFKKII